MKAEMYTFEHYKSWGIETVIQDSILQLLSFHSQQIYLNYAINSPQPGRASAATLSSSSQ